MATLTCTATTTNNWYGWNDVYWVTATDSTWAGWTSGTITTSNNILIRGNHNWAPAEQTEQQKAAAKKAKQRAERLLDESLSEAQREELAKERYFTVEGGGSKRRYRIKAGKGVHGNVWEVDEQGREVASLCAAPRGSLPEADALIAQKLWLEHNEEEFRKVANISQRRVA